MHIIIDARIIQVTLFIFSVSISIEQRWGDVHDDNTRQDNHSAYYYYVHIEPESQ